MIILNFLEHGQKKALLNNHFRDKDNILDELTLNYLTMMNTFSDIEKHLIYALIMKPIRVLKKDLTKKDLSTYLTTKDLSNELKIETKKLSVYLKRLCILGIVDRKLKNEKHYEYNVINKVFIDWFLFRQSKKVKSLIESKENDKELLK